MTSCFLHDRASGAESSSTFSLIELARWQHKLAAAKCTPVAKSAIRDYLARQ